MKKFALLLLIPFLFTACKKDESPEPFDPARNGSHFPGPKAEMLINKQWKLVNKTVEYTNGLPREDFSNVPDCEKDNLISFAKNKKCTVDEAINVCPNTNKTHIFDWATADNEQTLVINNTKWQLVSISDTQMQLKYVSQSNVLTATTIETYIAQ